MSWTNILKKGIITIFVLAIGLVMFFTLGFNKNYDFTGGTTFSVNVTEYVTANQDATNESATKLVKDIILSNDNVKIYSITNGIDNNDTVVIFKYQISKDVDTTNASIFNQTFEQLGYDKTDVLDKTYVNMTTEIHAAYSTGVFIYALFGILIAAIACAIYMWIRFGFTSAIGIIISTAIDVGVFLALLLILRLFISSHIGYAILAVGAISIMVNAIVLGRLCSDSLKPHFEKATNKDVAESVLRKLLKPTAITLCGVAIVFVILSTITYGTTGGTLYGVAIAMLSVFATSLFITPNIWKFAFVRKYKEPKRAVEVEVEHE